MNMAKWSCPFTWGLEKLFNVRTSMTKRNLDEYVFSGIPLMTFLISIIRSFENFQHYKNEYAARKHLEEAESILSQFHIDAGMRDIIEALEHIYQATAMYILPKGALTSGGYITSQTVPDIEDFNEIQLAGLAGCKSFILSLYQLHCVDEAIVLAKNAVEGNPKNALWYYTRGHCLRKKRRNTEGCNIPPTPIETTSFTMAAQLCPHPFFQIYSIQATHEANFSSLANRSVKLAFSKMQWNMYEDMRHTCNDQPIILLKIALGMLRCLPIGNYSVIHSILDRVDELSKENNVSYFYRGSVYRHQQQFEKALEYLKRSADMGNFVADLDYLYCMFRSNKSDVDLIIHLVRMRMKYKNEHPEQQLTIHLNIAIMYYIIKDYKTSAELFCKAIETLPDSKQLKRKWKFLSINMNSTYDFLRTAILPRVKETTEGDAEFAEILRRLSYYCTKDLEGPYS